MDWIDGRYRILKRFGGSSEHLKMVFLAEDMKDNQRKVVVKVFTLEESNEYAGEVQRNMLLQNFTLLIKMIRHKKASLKIVPFDYEEESFELYNYIVVPYCEKGTLLDLLMKAISMKKKLSVGLQQYLCRQLV